MLPLFVTDRLAGLIFWVSYLGWFALELLSTFRYTAGPAAMRQDRYSRFAIFAGFFVALSAGFAFAFWARAFTITWERPAVFYAGIVLIWAGVIFRWYAASVLGKYFTLQVAIQAGQTVVEAGPYRWIRHPSYSGTLLTILGLGLAMTNWLSLVAMPVILSLGYGYRVWVEEQTLVQALGEPYRAYMRRTKRFIPGIW